MDRIRKTETVFHNNTDHVKGVIPMAEKKKSKTDVAARAGMKTMAKTCRNCGNTVDVVLTVTATGKKRMRRICCGE